MPTSHDIRQQFIDYFIQQHGHTFVPSAPVVPHEDATLLFANAGMNQFKDVFLATGTRPYNRAANTQKCIRAGGKHNDLEDVGQDTYHHTFFEMLGNWSFGDYFKTEAIEWAWDLLTNVWGLEKSRLYATVFAGDQSDGLEPDHESQQIWQQVTDIDPSHISRWGKKDNFWEMGETGPCGPCSEIHIDLTPDGSGASLVNKGDPHVIEIWNLVFIQFNRDSVGQLTPLPANHVDTGMGLERVVAVIQNQSSNYDTDLWTPLFDAIHNVTGAKPYGASMGNKVDVAYRVIADHIRCLTFALTDGVVPSNDGRGYVLRRILRRAVRHGWQTLAMRQPFLHRLVPAVVDVMGEAFPEIGTNPQRVIDSIQEEEDSFGQTLERGIKLFVRAANNASEAHESELTVIKEHEVGGFDKQAIPDEAGQKKESPVISGEDAFRLHDTYGFPLDLTQVMAEEQGMSVDMAAFNQLMEQARAQARMGVADHVGGKDRVTDILQYEPLPPTKFVGYSTTSVAHRQVSHAYCWLGDRYESVEKLSKGEYGALIVAETPCYAEAGGQVGDTGIISHPVNGTFKVEDTVRAGVTVFHLGVVVNGEIHIAQSGSQCQKSTVNLEVDHSRRLKIMANHTITHMMNRALRICVNAQADQKGSLVDDEKTRFDFSHNAAMTVEQISQVEKVVNDDIAADLPVYYADAPQEEARTINGLRAVFGEKYPPRVRIVSIGVPVGDLLAHPTNPRWAKFSIEFCGGTHLAKTGDAERFVIISEEAVGKGVRRITAITGDAAHKACKQGNLLLGRLEVLSTTQPDQFADALAELSHEMDTTILPSLIRAKLRVDIAELQKIAKDHHKKRSKQAASNVVETARRIADEADGQWIITTIDGADAETLRTAMDVIKKKKPNAALLLASVTDDKVAFLAFVPESLINKGLHAGDWVRTVAKIVGGSGGGRPDMAQAGGKDPTKIQEALEAARTFASSSVVG